MSLLEINNLHTYFTTKRGLIKAVDGVSLKVDEGKTLGIVGESGSGKSVTVMSILKLFESNQKIHEGEIWFEGEKISEYGEDEIRKIRGNKISVIFQEPMTSLNPVMTVARQIGEVLMLHQHMNKEQARERTIQLLGSVGISNPEKIADTYSFQLSGGMSQRVMIAMALACRPKLLIADEPTTALDVTIQAQILRLMNDLKRELGTSIIFVTHDLGVINEMADDVVVMYCGQVVENAPAKVIFGMTSKYMHPYTEGLMRSIPRLSDDKNRKLDVIPGSVPHPLDLPVGCKFSPRCKYATEKCHNQEPETIEVEPGHGVRCFYPESEVRRSGKHSEE
ncbi:MAG TPA: ABC transporter ATP-binding protein [Bacillota bacterium]|nr:ABC transporter ATP-binding protein [Bacillota bacterium]HPF41921.1 ABC transporter ATP-binding protein [Bacillota bacterium]HPJ85606.1 ABC transporter ATP-binding protein [Bacillota bacterium]HPQ61442.1 ABC transporter ATP-binding protein [Bacillota bacterium]